MEITEVAQLVSHGGVVALALIVWYELRTVRAAILGINTTITKLLERDEIVKAIRDEISGVHEAPQLEARTRGDDNDDTPVDSPRGEYRQIKKRAQSEPGGVRREARPRIQIPRKPAPRPDRDDDPGDDAP